MVSKTAIELGKNSKMLEDLFRFVDKAEQLGTYPANTAAGARAALRALSSVLTQEEAESLDTFRSNLEAILGRVSNKKNISPVSLRTYQTRVTSLLDDYARYGQNHLSLASWKRKPRSGTIASPVGSKSKRKEENEIVGSQGVVAPQAGGLMTRLELPLRPNTKAILLLPEGLSKAEAERIKSYIDASVVNK